jgi:hypothetical protein
MKKIKDVLEDSEEEDRRLYMKPHRPKGAETRSGEIL